MTNKRDLPSLFIGLTVAALLLSLGSLVSVSIDMIVAYASVIMLMALTALDYFVSERKRPEPK